MNAQSARASLVLLLSAGALGALCGCKQRAPESKAESAGPSVPLESVTFGMLPYGDHTYAIIGVRNGWFREAGIDLEYRSIKVEEIVPSLKNGTLDVVSCPPGILFASFDADSDLVSFVFGDLFEGYAIMARPDSSVHSYQEFRDRGLSHESAVRAAAGQLRGKRFAYPSEAAIKPFIDLVLKMGGLARSAVRSLVLDDPLTVNAMRNGQADFQVGGVPSRLLLQREGFQPILTSMDLARGASPSPRSPELASILQNGWATTRQFYERHHDAILRVASVNFRIMDFINRHPEEAAAIQMPYLSQLSGQDFQLRDGWFIYKDLDPFYTFENQRDWFHNLSSPFFYAYVNGSILNSFVQQHIYKRGAPRLEGVIYADDIYRELEQLRARTDSLLDAAARRGYADTGTVLATVAKARQAEQRYDFAESVRLAKSVVDQLGAARN